MLACGVWIVFIGDLWSIESIEWWSVECEVLSLESIECWLVECGEYLLGTCGVQRVLNGGVRTVLNGGEWNVES